MQNLLSIRQIQKNAVNRTGHQLESSERDFLMDLRNNDACDLGPLAQTLLVTFAGFEEEEVLCNAQKKLATSIKKETRIVSMNAYPNPSNTGWVVVKVSKPALENSTFSLYDATSRIVKNDVMKANQQELFMDVSDLAAGVYWLRSSHCVNETIQIIIQ